MNFKNISNYSKIFLCVSSLMLWGNLAFANTLPIVSGVIAVASEPVSIKTTSLEGKVTNRTAGIGQSIYLNDEIKTGPNTKMQILLKDQTVFNIGPNSVLTIDKFVFDPSKGELSVGIQKGAFRFVSGKVSDGNPDAMKVKLPNATISVRGTGVAGNVAPDGGATVVLLHGKVDVAGAAGNSSLSKSGWGVQVTPNGAIGKPAAVPPDVIKNIITSVAQVKTPSGSTVSQSTQSDRSSQTTNTTSLPSNSGLTVTELNNSVDASRFVSAETAQNFKTSMFNSLNTQAALNSNPDKIPVSVLNDTIRNNPKVWAAILQSLGMPPDTQLPDAAKQDALSQYINSEFARYYALLVFPKTYTSSEIINGSIGPLGTVTFTIGNVVMSCQSAGACGANPTATINNHTVTLNYTAAQMANSYNISYSNFNGASGTISGSATAAFSALTPANAQSVQLPLSNNSGPGSTTLNMIGQFGSIGTLEGKFATLTTAIAQSPSAVMRAGYQVKGQ